MEGHERESEETGFVIDGVSYPVPTLDTITLDEERVLFTYADVVVQDFLPPHPDWKEHVVAAYQLRQAGKFRDPSFKRALAHIAYRRAHPEVEDSEIEEQLGSLVALDVDFVLIGSAEDGADPLLPTSRSAHDSTTQQSAPENSGDSGTRTDIASEIPGETPDISGTTESDTSFPRSHATT